MNREIKFRIWDTLDKCFKKIKWGFDSEANLVFWDGYERTFVKSFGRYILQQFTGLKDKSGREVYEGDILRFYKNKPYQADYEVYWKKHGFSLISAKRDGDDFGVYTKNLHLFKGDEPEIIGNIFENPELLNNA